MATAEDRSATIFSCNTYLIPWFSVEYYVRKNPEISIESCKDQTVRAERIGKAASQFDIVALQEMWGSDADVVEGSIKDSHSIVERNKSHFGVLGTGWFATAFNAYNFNKLRNGGLYFASRHALPVVWERHLNFAANAGEEGIFKSLSIVLVNMDALWPKKHLLILNTHLHSPQPYGDSEQRRAQRKEVRDALIAIQEEEKYPDGFLWSSCGVMYMGDFNTACHKREIPEEYTAEYLETLTSFVPSMPLRDLYLETNPDCRKFTYDGAGNQYVSKKSQDDSARLDYIFAADAIPSRPSSAGSSASSGDGFRRVMRLENEGCNILYPPPGEEFSDHHPVIAKVRPAL
eukprot:Opistho-2@86054